MADEEVQVRITGDASGAEEAMSRASGAVKGGVDGMKDAFDGIGGAAKDLKDTLSTAFQVAGIAIAYEGFEKLKDSIDEAALSAVQMRNAANVIGVSATEMQGLRAAAEEAGVGSETMTHALEMLSLRMQQARDGSAKMQDKLAAVGITLQNLADPSFTAASAAVQIAESHATLGEKLDLVGRRGIALLPVFAGLAGGEQGAIEKARELGALTDEQVSILARYHESISAAAERWDFFKDKLLVSVAPAVSDLLLRLQDMFGVLNDGTRTSESFRETVVGVEVEVLKWAAAFRQLYLDVSHVFTEIGTSIGNVAAVIAAAATGSFSRAKEIWKEGTADLLAIDQQYAADTLANENRLSDAINKAQQKRASDVHIDRVDGDAMANPVVQATEKMIRTSEKWAEMEIRDADAVLNTMKKVAELTAQADEESKLGQVAAAQKVLEEELKAGQVSASQFLQQDLALINQRLAIEEEYYQKKKALAVGDEVELAKIQVEINKAEASALKERQTAENQAQQASLAQWKQLGSSMESSFSSNVTKMIEGTKTFGDTLRSLMTTAIDGVIQMFVKMAVQWAENMITQQVLGKTTAVSEITANASVAATAAMASVAAIPFVGWAMAPGVGAATEAEGLSYLAGVSAAGGYDVPSGINPVTQLHAKEMVLPAQLADAVRAMTSVAGGQAGARSANVTLQGKQIGNMFMAHLDDLADAFNQLVRTRHIGAGRAF